MSTLCLHLTFIMSSRKEGRDVALYSFIMDEELILLLDSNRPKNPESLHNNSYDRFDLDEMNEAECKAKYRIEEREIFISADALAWPTSDL